MREFIYCLQGGPKIGTPFLYALTLPGINAIFKMLIVLKATIKPRRLL